MLNFLFWNVNRKPLTETIYRLARRYDSDVIILAENTVIPGDILKALNQVGRSDYHFLGGLDCKTVQLFVRFSRSFVRTIVERRRVTIQKVELPGRLDFSLSALHLNSKVFKSNENQKYDSFDLAELIHKAEEITGSKKTLLVGDFNANPFEEGIVSSKGLHAVMARQIAERGGRIVGEDGKNFPFLYNPMWAHLGDRAGTVPGTYYWEKKEPICYFWYLFDQVMMRPDLLPYWIEDELEIITGDGQESFISDTSGKPRKNLSDHLPIRFSLNV